MELLNISKEILKQIKDMDVARFMLKERAERRSKAIADYDKAMALTTIKLSQGVPFDVNGSVIENPKVTILKEIAKGVCYKEKLLMDQTEAAYKNCIVNIDCIKTSINALQSIMRYQHEIETK